MSAADTYRTGSLSGPGKQPEAVSYAAVTANYFSVFGATPELGPGVCGQARIKQDTTMS